MGKPANRPSTSERELEDAYADAARTSSRASLLGALGFGFALLMGLRLASEDGFFVRGFGLDLMLFVGGLVGGVVFTVLALRAARVAKLCRRQLERLEGGRKS